MKLKDVDIKEIAKLLDQHESKAKIASISNGIMKKELM